MPKPLPINKEPENVFVPPDDDHSDDIDEDDVWDVKPSTAVKRSPAPVP